MDGKLDHVAGAVIRPLGIDVTIDKDDLIKMSREKFHQVSGHPWGGILDATARSWLMKRKDDVPQRGLKLMDELVAMGKGPPAFLRMDRASENRKMAELIKGKCPKVKTECTSNNTLQQNGKV